MFIMSLAIADLTVGLFVMPISSAYAITGTVGPSATLSLGPKILQHSSNQRCLRLMLFSSGIF